MKHMSGMQEKITSSQNAQYVLPEHPSDTTPSQDGRTRKLQKSHRKRFLLPIGILLVICVMSTVYGTRMYQQARTARLIPQSIRDEVDFPLYYPISLPYGYTAEPITSTGNPVIVTVMIKGPKAEIIYITQQKKPSNFDFDFFYNKTLLVSRELNVSIGKIRIGSAKGRPDNITASLVAEPTWLLVSYPTTLPQQDIDTILTSLKKT